MKTSQIAVLVGSSVAAAGAFAVDVTSVTTALTEAATTVGVIGAAALGVVVVVKTFRYIRSAF